MARALHSDVCEATGEISSDRGTHFALENAELQASRRNNNQKCQANSAARDLFKRSLPILFS